MLLLLLRAELTLLLLLLLLLLRCKFGCLCSASCANPTAAACHRC
jgi:branched-subunit amino acid ABC-type transport system permease component